MIVESEVMTELVNHGVADLMARFCARVRDAEDGSAKNRDLIG